MKKGKVKALVTFALSRKLTPEEVTHWSPIWTTQIKECLGNNAGFNILNVIIKVPQSSIIKPAFKLLDDVFDVTQVVAVSETMIATPLATNMITNITA